MQTSPLIATTAPSLAIDWQAQVVYRHSDFIVLNKPAGVSVHKDDSLEGLTTVLAKALSLPQLWLVHRLDKVTSGLLILALNARAASALSQLFALHQVQKTYVAISDKRPKAKAGTVKGDMQKGRNGSWKLCHTQENSAHTYFVCQSLQTPAWLFLLRPYTGKTHQLRVAMKSLGSPILGDKRYQGSPANRTCLHAWRLQFTYNSEQFDIQCLPNFFPENSQWQQPLLQRLLLLEEKLLQFTKGNF